MKISERKDSFYISTQNLSNMKQLRQLLNRQVLLQSTIAFSEMIWVHNLRHFYKK